MPFQVQREKERERRNEKERKKERGREKQRKKERERKEELIGWVIVKLFRININIRIV